MTRHPAPTLRLALLAVLLGPIPLAAVPRAAWSGDLVAARAAVGRVGIGDRAAQGAGGCTGVLVAPDVVLTATHCVVDPASGQAAAPEAVYFAPSPDAGPAEATFPARRILLPSRSGPVGGDARFDVARIDLATPVPASVAGPLPQGTPDPADIVLTLGYPSDPAQSLAVHADCPIVFFSLPVVEIACPARSGYSGGPVLRDGTTGPEVAAIMVARQKISGRDMTIAVLPEPGLWPGDGAENP